MTWNGCAGVVAVAMLVSGGPATPLRAQAERWLPASHADRGLPAPAASWTPFAAAPDHPANRVFRACWLVHTVPAEVGAALPGERGAEAGFFAAGWYFGKRAGGDGDARWFGGDGRQLPRERFDAEAAAALRQDLAAIDGDVAAALRAQPRLAIWLQSDLLRMARRLLDTDANADLLEPLLRAAERLALPAAKIADPALATFALADLTAVAPGIEPAHLVELQRRSTQLFDAEHSGMWSSVFVGWPDDGLLDWLHAPSAVPIGTTAVLVQGLMALDETGAAVATPVVVDVRLQRLANRDDLAATNATTTRDGVDFRVFWLERQRLRELADGGATAVGLGAFRAVADADQVLFRDYGTTKWTTVAAQCALCHRRTHTPDEPLAGFLALRPSAKPRPVQGADERQRAAEVEFVRFVATLRAAAK